MDAGKRNINEIFISSRILEVPFFQRSYVWQEAQWSRFLEDMEYVSAGSEPYFMGSLILKQQATDSASRIGDIPMRRIASSGSSLSLTGGRSCSTTTMTRPPITGSSS